MDNTYQTEVEAPQADALQPEKKKRSQFLRVLVSIVAVSLIGAGSLFGKGLLSCSSATGTPHPVDNMDIQYLPFQAEEGGDWGLISLDGEVLFANEFKEQPTVATNDRFFVKNSDGLWEMYTATEKPQKVGDEYVFICPFSIGCDVTPAVRKGQGIEFIDKDGNVKFKFDKVNGKLVEACTAFIAEGYALFTIDGGEYNGIVDTNGNIALQPEYGLIESKGGYFLIYDRPRIDIDGYTPNYLLDKDGYELCSNILYKYPILSCREVDNCRETYIVDGKMGVLTPEGRGIIDKDGNMVLKPSQNISEFGYFDGKKLIFKNNDQLWGAQTLDGKSIVQAKYDYLYPMKGFCGYFAQESADTSGCILLDENGERIGTKVYEGAITMPWDKVYAKTSQNEWILLDTKGHEIKLKQNIANLGELNNYNSSVYADNGPSLLEAKTTICERYATRLNKLAEEVAMAKDEHALQEVYYVKYRVAYTHFNKRIAAANNMIDRYIYRYTTEEEFNKDNEQYGEANMAANQKLQNAVRTFFDALSEKSVALGYDSWIDLQNRASE